MGMNAFSQKLADELLKSDGPAAIVAKQWFKPVGDEIIFPPTYASPKDSKGDSQYNIDHGICVIDSVQSQANRMEEAFLDPRFAKLVPTVEIKAEVANVQTTINLLQAGHRIADAIMRFSSYEEKIDAILAARKRGDSTPLAKFAPTSIVFGAWDSRGTGAKIPRLINSVIRAYNVKEFTRSAQYVPAIHDYTEAGVVSKAGDAKFSNFGLSYVPSSGVIGGIVAEDGIIRHVSINLCTLRDVKSEDQASTRTLQHYILGLILVAFTLYDETALNLRQGCLLVSDPDKQKENQLVYANGEMEQFFCAAKEALEFAESAAAKFGVGSEELGTFDPNKAMEAMKTPDKKTKGDTE